MTPDLAATIFYLHSLAWIAVGVMWSVLPDVIRENSPEPKPAHISGDVLARAFRPVRERR